LASGRSGLRFGASSLFTLRSSRSREMLHTSHQDTDASSRSSSSEPRATNHDAAPSYPAACPRTHTHDGRSQDPTDARAAQDQQLRSFDVGTLTGNMPGSPPTDESEWGPMTVSRSAAAPLTTNPISSSCGEQPPTKHTPFSETKSAAARGASTPLLEHPPPGTSAMSRGGFVTVEEG